MSWIRRGSGALPPDAAYCCPAARAAGGWHDDKGLFGTVRRRQRGSRPAQPERRGAAAAAIRDVAAAVAMPADGGPA
jgi:hypothetical protein